MCTAATYKTADFYFGRTLDYEFSYGDEVAVLPRNYALAFRHMGTLKAHYAIIGMAYVVGDYPLYYDGINEKGLGMAGLNFVGNAVYQEVGEGRENIAQFEFIPWILAQCASVEEAREKLDKMNLVGTQFGEQLPAAQLHWIIADEKECIVVECMVDGLHVYDNPVGVLTNNPPFPQQMFFIEPVYASFPEAAGQYVLRAASIGAVQPRYGSVGTAGRSFFHIAFCPRGVYQTACYVRRVRGGKCQSVFPHFRFG